MRILLTFIATISCTTFGWFAPRVKAADLELAWEFATPQHLPLAVVADKANRPFAYVALKSGGLSVLNVSARAARQAAQIPIQSFQQMDVMNLFQHGELLFVALGGHFAAPGTKHVGLAVVSVVDPRNPKVLSVWKSPQKLKGGAVVVADDKFAYLGAMSAGVMIFDITKPQNIRQLSTFQPDIDFPRKNPGRVQHPNSRGLAIRDNLLFVANDAGGLRILDVTDHEKPQEIGRYINQTMVGKQQAYNNIVIDGKRAYAAIDYAGLEILDISNPRQPRQLGWWNPWEADTLKNLWLNSPGHTNQLLLDSHRKLVYLSAGDSELVVVDVANPKKLRKVNQYGQPKNKLSVWGLGASDQHIYLTYIKAIVPFHSTWSGIKALKRP